jgi:hypothetical protein
MARGPRASAQRPVFFLLPSAWFPFAIVYLTSPFLPPPLPPAPRCHSMMIAIFYPFMCLGMLTEGAAFAGIWLRGGAEGLRPAGRAHTCLIPFPWRRAVPSVHRFVYSVWSFWMSPPLHLLAFLFRRSCSRDTAFFLSRFDRRLITVAGSCAGPDTLVAWRVLGVGRATPCVMVAGGCRPPGPGGPAAALLGERCLGGWGHIGSGDRIMKKDKYAEEIIKRIRRNMRIRCRRLLIQILPGTSLRRPCRHAGH